MKTALMGLLVLMLIGCKTHDTYAGFDDAWLKPCTLIPPPDGDTYTKASPEGRATLWSQVYINQMEETTLCNNRTQKVREFLNEVKGNK